jgi:cytochrome b561
MALSSAKADSAVAASSQLAHSRIVVALHWWIALLIAAEFALGWWMLGVPKTPPGLRAGWYNFHKSVGLVVLVAVLVRMVWRAAHRQAGVDALPAWQRTAAQIMHGLLYACMLLMPLTGLAGSMFTRYPIRFFGIVLPIWQRDWPAAKQLMSDVHDAIAWLFLALIALHVAAALWHWWQKDAVAARMGMPELPSA